MNSLRSSVVVALALVASSAMAQSAKSAGSRGPLNVPPGQLPPRGQCRVWVDGLPPGQQAPVTDCATAALNRPANSTLIFGDQASFPGKGKGRFKTAAANGEVARSCVNHNAVVIEGRLVGVCTDANGRVIGDDSDKEKVKDRSAAKKSKNGQKKAKAKGGQKAGHKNGH